jgi:dTDP-4-dehydrorhamnose reductase
VKLLVTGRSGQVARALAGLTGSAAIICLGRPELNICDRASVDRAIALHRPEVVVNTAAYTAVDKAESEPDLAFAANAGGAGNVAAAAARAGLPVIHLSTDYVFSGDKRSPYVETDPVGPAGVYGQSKLAGEEAVAAANPDHVILRTAWVHAPWGGNFVRTMLRLAGERDTVRVIVDQHGTPTYAPHIADALLAVARYVIAARDGGAWRGVFHMTSAGETTWAGFAERVFAAARHSGLNSASVVPIATSEYPTAARRPANSRLDNTRFDAVFRAPLPAWQVGVDACVAALAAASEPSAR